MLRRTYVRAQHDLAYKILRFSIHHLGLFQDSADQDDVSWDHSRSPVSSSLINYLDMLRVKLLSESAKAPTIAHPGEDLGYDLYASETAIIPARGHHIVPTGISIELHIDGRPAGALIRDKSSMAARRVICTAGVIDAGYRGEIRIVMENLGDEPAEIHQGDKIANLIPYPVYTSAVEVVEDLAVSSRNAGGFGSSGKR